MFSKKAKTPVSERNGACLTCHQKDAKRALWGGSQHETADLACSSCHKNHTNQDKVLARVDADGRLLHLPQGAAHAARQAVAPPGARRQDELLGLPQRARLGRAQAGQARQHQRHLLHLPRRKARAVRAHPRAGDGGLRHLPQPARQHRGRRCSRPGRRCCASSATRRTWPAASAPSAASRASSRPPRPDSFRPPSPAPPAARTS